jgi:hypothetical protein
MVEEMIGWMRRARIDSRQVRIPRPEARQVAELTLAWWIYSNCPVCTGRQFKLGQGGQYLTASVCPACHGTGKRPVPSKIRAERRALASWLFAELDTLVSFMIAEMARKMNTRANL